MSETQGVDTVVVQLVEQQAQGMSKQGTQYLRGEVPYVACPHSLHLEPLAQLPEHHFYALPYARQHPAPLRVGVLAALAVRRYQLHPFVLSQLLGKGRSPIVAPPIVAVSNQDTAAPGGPNPHQVQLRHISRGKLHPGDYPRPAHPRAHSQPKEDGSTTRVPSLPKADMSRRRLHSAALAYAHTGIGKLSIKARPASWLTCPTK